MRTCRLSSGSLCITKIPGHQSCAQLMATLAACAARRCFGLLDQTEISDQLSERGISLSLVSQAEQRRRMKRGEHERGQRALHEAAAHGGDLEILADHRLGRRRAEATDDLRGHGLDLVL